MKWKDAEAEFAELLTEAKRDAEKANLPQPEIKRLTAAQPSDDPIERLRAIASISPKAAVFAAWQEVERAATELYIRRKGEPPRGIMDVHAMLRQLFESKEIDLNTYKVFENLRQLRNLSAHAFEHTVSVFDALGYAQLAIGMAEALKSLPDKPSQR